MDVAELAQGAQRRRRALPACAACASCARLGGMEAKTPDLLPGDRPVAARARRVPRLRLLGPRLPAGARPSAWPWPISSMQGAHHPADRGLRRRAPRCRGRRQHDPATPPSACCSRSRRSLAMLTVVFVLVRLVPGDPALVILGDQANGRGARGAARAARPRSARCTQYLDFLGGMLHRRSRPLAGQRHSRCWSEVLLRDLPYTIELTSRRS